MRMEVHTASVQHSKVKVPIITDHHHVSLITSYILLMKVTHFLRWCRAEFSFSVCDPL